MDLSVTSLVISGLAGVLTVLTPCVLPLLPIIISGSSLDRRLWRPLRIILALAVSVITFTLLLKVSTAFWGIPDGVWKGLSGGIILGFGLLMLFPHVWERLSDRSRLKLVAGKLLGRGLERGGVTGDILIGASLGPIFSACGPTYGIIVAEVLPTEFWVGLIYLGVYVTGLALMLCLIALFGHGLSRWLGVFSNPHGWFKRFIAIVFLATGLAIITGLDKKAEAWLIERGFYDPLIQIEEDLIDNNPDNRF